MAPPDTIAVRESLFRPGENCSAVARAERVAFIVDAEEYFQAFVHAAERAEHSLFILAWDFDSRAPLGVDSTGNQVTVGEFLNRLAAQRKNLRIRVLDWDFPVVYGTDRELPPTYGTSWKPHKRIDFRFDDTHPFIGSHHQKIVVIDDRLAFCGGLDLTNKRWDTRKHSAEDPRRVFEDKPYPPFHAVMIAVDGDAAEALAKVARERWHAATGETLKAVKAKNDPWPEEIPVHVAAAQVSVACTYPACDDHKGVHHIEKLYIDMIRGARNYIYIENQYFTSEKVGAALTESLAQPDGPEIVVVTRLLSHGWLEEVTMTALRTQLVRDLREADHHGRFHVYYPDVPGLCEGTCLDIHSKVMVVDDEWLRIGSANLSNRSMGMDTECDVTLEARGEKRVKNAIREFRDGLLAEFLEVDAKDVAREIKRCGTMKGAIDAIATGERKLKILEAPELPEAKLAVAKVGDPQEPVLEGIARHISPGRAAEAVVRRFPVARAVLAAIVLAAIVLALVWTRTPLADVVTRDNAMALAHGFADLWWAPLLVVAAYTPASLIMFPRWMITMTAVIAFGPWQGFTYAMSGVILAGIATFLPGRLIGRGTLERVVGPGLKKLSKILQQKGLIAVTLVRLVPIAPFPVVNLAMGAVRIRLRDFVGGTFLGMLPGMLAATVLSDQLAAALEDPTRVNGWLIAAALAMLGSLAYFGQRWLRRHPA